MLRKHFLFWLVIGCAGVCSCRKDLLHWRSATPLSSGTTHRLNRICFANDTLGFIVGGERFAYADILITKDGGRSWQYRDFPEVGKALYGITARPDGNIYAIGFEGRLLHSKDYGSTWARTDQKYAAYKAIATGSGGTLLMIGGISFDYGFIQRADAAGNSGKYDSLNFELNDICMLPDGTGYISGYGAALKTTDDGVTWTRTEVGRDNFKGLYAASSNDVWTCGYNGSIYHSTDGGGSWQRMRNGNDLTLPRYHLEQILFISKKEGYAVGEQGVVIYTDDAGVHWSAYDRFTTETLHSVARCPDGSLLVCGDNGTLYRLEKK